jgi:putative CocE/NonD family hydrolase
MRKKIVRLCLSIVVLVCFSSNLRAQQLPGAQRIMAMYSKSEVRIPMPDGTTLFAAVYAPRDRAKNYPIMLKRTPYGCQPYGEDRYNPRIGPSAVMEDEGYIFVHQDVRGRWMSEGSFDNMRPHVEGDVTVDESSDTFHTIDWLIKNVQGNNGKVGMWGVSYAGFYSAAALAEQHPALACASPQAPIADFFFDDFHHHGTYTLSYLFATNTFGYQHEGPSNWKWYSESAPTERDPWKFYLELLPLSEAEDLFPEGNEFWRQINEHPNYDSFWQSRNILPHLSNVKASVLTVGGLFDAEDLYGPLAIYRSLEKNNPNIFNVLVMGPWAHGDWSQRGDNVQRIGAIEFGRGLATDFQNSVEAPFFAHYLKGAPEQPDFEALMFDTGTGQWKKYRQWPPATAQTLRLNFTQDKTLKQQPEPETTFHQFISDPHDPVPYRAKKKIKFRFTPRDYMTDDQRFASMRDDVLVFQTNPLKAPLTVTGDLTSHLRVSTSQSAADWVVKLIDVYPDDYVTPPSADPEKPRPPLASFQQMIRSDVIRGRFRDSYVTPQPFTPGKIETVNLPLQDVHHTFRTGHRIMIHVQSTWFPLIDRNPQKYVDNIFKAQKEDYVAAEHRVYCGGEDGSYIEMKISK